MQRLFATAAGPPTDDFFDVSPDAMKHLQTHSYRKPNAFGGTTQRNSRADVDKSTTLWRLSRFCDVCRAYNIDPLCPVSLHLVWILGSKCRDKAGFVHRFAELTSHTETAACVDWEAAHEPLSIELNDWLALLQYTSIASSTSSTSDPSGPSGPGPSGPSDSPGVLTRRLAECWAKSKLGDEYETTSPFLQHKLLYIMLEAVPAAKALEMRLSMIRRLEERPVCRDLELRCLRCVANFNNEVLSDETIQADCMPALLHLQIHADMRRDIVSVLKMKQTQSEAHDTELRKAVGRMQLRFLAKQLHASKKWVYSATFDAWATQQQFAVTTTRRQQALLYFIKVQGTPCATDKLRRFFSANILRRLHTQSVDQIDARAVLSVIQSIRLYTHNVKTLVDFRMQCLSGISQSFKKTLNMAQILQLYVCCFQHASIQEACWKGVVPVWNYTIQCACDKFAKNNTYEIDAVLDCLLACMLDSEVSREAVAVPVAGGPEATENTAGPE
jgi:hypothetical protein